MSLVSVGSWKRREWSALLALLERRSGFGTAQDLYYELRAAGERVGLPTVYRWLQLLVDEDGVEVMWSAKGEKLYRRCGSGGHHHHLVCRGCGVTVEVTGSAVEDWVAGLGPAERFVDVEHTLELFGTCAGCATGDEAGHEEQDRERTDL